MQQVCTYVTTEYPHLLTGNCLLCGLRQHVAKKRGAHWYLNCYGYYRAPTAHRCTSHSIREDIEVRATMGALRALTQNQVGIR